MFMLFEWKHIPNNLEKKTTSKRSVYQMIIFYVDTLLG